MSDTVLGAAQSIGAIIAGVAILALIGFFLGRARAVAAAGGRLATLHSRPSYHGSFVMIWTALPSLLLLAAWVIAQPIYVERQVIGLIPADVMEREGQPGLALSQIANVAEGFARLTPAERDQVNFGLREARSAFERAGVPQAGFIEEYMIEAGQLSRAQNDFFLSYRWIAVLGLAVLGLVIATARVGRDLRARNSVERIVRTILMLASAVAILTTVGIVYSMLDGTLDFFSIIPPQEFFFNTTWNPGFSNAGEVESNQEFGLLPLLWGTLYISIIALLIAVPIGLNAAIYMSEFASERVRSVAKPLLEVLAGIPTIVYGFFALITVGPVLREAFETVGIPAESNSVLTAGIVMGIMIVPFVSSLSDDIINAVPQSLRDGSYGLGATKAETIRLVILPAALPGIVGAVLLAASRAIGETMIVLLAAGATARLSADPLEAMTTVTVKIVSQLTGDGDFTQPEVLVAYALGTTLFVVTLLMNIFALRIVRKYREQYE